MRFTSELMGQKGPWSKAGHMLLLQNPLSSTLEVVYQVFLLHCKLIYMQHRPPGTTCATALGPGWDILGLRLQQ